MCQRRILHLDSLVLFLRIDAYSAEQSQGWEIGKMVSSASVLPSARRYKV
jgi:hypothetical protein